MESISSLAKKHCHCAYNIISILLLAGLIAASASGLYFLGFSQLHLFVIISSVFLFVSAIIHAAGAALGCTLLRIPLMILTVFSFIVALISIAVGYAFSNSENTEEFVNSILAAYGYKLTVTANVVGMAFMVCGVAALLLSFCLLSGVRYFTSIKKCLNGEIKRGGAKLFGYFAFLTFLLSCAVIIMQFYLVWNSGDLDKMVTLPENVVVLEVLLSSALLFIIGLSANSFSKKTYAFKIFESQMMKVETNADGTVYVPISEEKEDKSENVEKSNEAGNISDTSKKPDEPKKKKITKPYIPESQIIPENLRDEYHEQLNECDII